jgi:hypothetical protein
VLTTQVAHWNEASSDIVQLAAQHQKYIEKLRGKFQKRLRSSLDEVLRGSMHLVQVLLASLKELLLGAVADVKFDSVLAEANRISLTDRAKISAVSAARELMESASSSSSSSMPTISSSRNIDASSLDGLAGAAGTAGIGNIAGVAGSDMSAEAIKQALSNSDGEFLGRAYLRDTGVAAVECSSVSHTFVNRLDNITGLLTSLVDICGDGDKKRNRFAHVDRPSGKQGQEASNDSISSLDNSADESGSDDDEDSVSGTSNNKVNKNNKANKGNKGTKEGHVDEDNKDDLLGKDSSDSAKVVVDKMKKLSAEMKPLMRAWVEDVLNSIKSMSRAERAVYLRGLHLADAEGQIINKRMRSLQRKLSELESKLIDSRMSCEGATPSTFPLIEKNMELQAELERLHESSASSLLNSLSVQVNDFTDATEIEQAIKFQLFNMRALLIKEEEAMASHHLQANELKAVQHRHLKLSRQIQQYEDRLINIQAGKNIAKASIVADIEVYQTCVNKVIPNDLIRKLLSWANVHDDEAKRRDSIEQERAQLSPILTRKPSPNRGTNNNTSINDNDDISISSKDTMGTNVSSTSTTASLALKSDFLESAQKSLALPSSKLRFGAIGTMPPAPARSVLNINNVLTPKPKANVTKSKTVSFVSPYSFPLNASAGGGGGGGAVNEVLPPFSVPINIMSASLDSGESSGHSLRIKSRLRPLKHNVKVEPVQRGGLVSTGPHSMNTSSSTASINVPAVGAGESSVRPDSHDGSVDST